MASRSINRVQLLGNLTRDPELKYTPSGAPVCTFGIATNRSWATQEGQTKEETQYHRIVAWNKLAELCAKLLTKGRKAYIEGRIAYRSFIGKDGLQKTMTEVVMEDFIVFGDGRRTVEEEVTTEEVKDTQVEEKSAPVGEESKTKKKKEKDEGGEAEEEETINPEDIPF